jgi:hypothetical protein
LLEAARALEFLLKYRVALFADVSSSSRGVLAARMPRKNT